MEAIDEAFKVSPQSAGPWQFLGWIESWLGNDQASIEALEKSCELQEGGTGDCAQWIVLALAHARLAAQENLPENLRESHQIEARRRYEAANQQIDATWRERPSNPFDQAIWDFRAQARELIGANVDNK